MDWFDTLAGMEKVFALCSAVGGVIFLLRMGLMVLGMEHGGGDIDAHADVGHGVDHDGDVDDSDASFHLLSLNTVTSFIMMFGLIGLSLMKAGLAAAIWATIVAVVGGFLTMLVVAKFFRFMISMKSSGTLDINRAVGAEGTVYLTIPAEGTGKVQVVIQERLTEFDAVSEDKVELKTGERIRVCWVVSGSLLSVKKAE